MKSIYVKNKEGNEVNLTVGRNYIIIYRQNSIQYEASGEILSITKEFINLGYTTVELSKIEDIIDISIK